ncbi:conserved protein, unknown function [Hepatocystis sp. ex Piliocolobus tephrosceles]|nr:conserved protein, unknown function [Hepatocystis sp. ex Piliocolobus tephrosceles]
MLKRLRTFFSWHNSYIVNKKYSFQFVSVRKYESTIFRKSTRKMLAFFYKEVHPDLAHTLPDELKKINNDSLSILNSYIDVLCTPVKDKENNIFIEKKIIFFKQYVNSNNVILKGRYKNFTIKLQNVTNNITFEQKENIIAKLIYDIQNALGKIKNTNESSKSINLSETGLENGLETDDVNDENIIDNLSHSSNKKKNQNSHINSIWDDLMYYTKNTQALYQPSEETVELIQKKKNYFYYIKKKLLYKYQNIKNKKRKKVKIQQINQVANKIAEEKFPQLESKNNYYQKNIDQSYKIINNGFNPNLIYFHKNIKQHQKQIAIQRLCGMHLKNDADKWLLENCLKLLKNHETPIPLIPLDFCLNAFFTFLENNLDQARKIRAKVLKSFD